MALSDSVNNSGSSDSADKPLVQFEDCTYDTNCKYKDINGRCIFETCIVQNELPPTTPLWYFECIACGKPDCIKPNDMRIHFCKTCIDQLQTAQKLPFHCIICGASQSHPSQGFGNQICDTCLAALKQAIDWRHRP